jgi:protein O-GlcNAc transferase
MMVGFRLVAFMLTMQAFQPASLGFQAQPVSILEDRLEAVRNAPSDPQAHLDLGLAYQELGDVELAMSELIEAIRLSPGNEDNIAARANFQLGMLLLGLDRVALAAGAYREAIRLGWRTAPVYTALGQALSAQGRHDEAISQYQEALRLAPDSFEPHAGLAWALEATGRDAEALGHYESALRFAPADEPHAAEVLEDRLKRLKARQQM